MNRFHTIIAIILLAGLSCGKKQESVGEMLDEFDSSWSVSSTYKVVLATTRKSNLIRINDDTRLELEGFTVWLNNFILDSRSSVMDYTEWNRLLTSSSLSQEDRLTRMSMLGDSGIVYPFESESGNRGFLVMNSKTSRTWAEVWDNQAIRRVRVDFEGKSPTTDEVPSLLSCLAALKWPEQEADQASTGEPSAEIMLSGFLRYQRIGKYHLEEEDTLGSFIERLGGLIRGEYQSEDKREVCHYRIFLWQNGNQKKEYTFGTNDKEAWEQKLSAGDQIEIAERMLIPADPFTKDQLKYPPIKFKKPDEH